MGGTKEIDPEVDAAKVSAAAEQGYFLVDDDDMQQTSAEIENHEMVGDVDLLTEAQQKSFFMLKESSKYPIFKVKRVSLSFSGASVFFMTPMRDGNVPMPASVLKFDSKECIEDEMEKTNKYRMLFGSTTPQVKDYVLVDTKDPSSVMQIDLCGGVFGLPEFAKAPPVHTFASILEEELKEVSMSVDIIPIINEALERRMYHFTMSDRKVSTLSLADSYKIVRFVGHGILNRAKEGAKRAAKSPALAAGFQNPVEVDDLDPEGKIIQELCGRKQTVRDMFQKFSGMESKLSEHFKRPVVVGLCHNDLHGGNLLVDSQGLVWLIDFATVESGKHVLMDLSKFLSACAFMYLQDSVNEKGIQAIAKILFTTPDATTDLPSALMDEVKDDPVARLFYQIMVRIRHCMCLYESGPGSPGNDGSPFAIALSAWSARMQSYSEPSLHQKTRALYWAVAGVQRLLWQMKEDIGPTASKWIEESLGTWEGQKGRRLSTSAAQDRSPAPAYEFELEFQTYCAQAGASEAWTTDILTREKVNVTEHCVELALKFVGSLNTRLILLPDKAKTLWTKITKVYKQFAPDLLTLELFCGRTLVVGDGGTGKSVLTKQLLAEVAQMEVGTIHERADAERKGPKDEGRATKSKPVPRAPYQVMVPLRVPLVDLARQLQESPDMGVDPDVLNDLLAVWMARKYGGDSTLVQLITQVRQASHEAADEEEAGVADNNDILGLFVLLDGLDEAAAERTNILLFITSLLEAEPCHFPLLTARPGVLGFAEKEKLAANGFIGCLMSKLPIKSSVQIASSILQRSKESEERTQRMLAIIENPAYAGLTGNPMCLTLLTHVLRKSLKEEASQPVVLTRTDMYQRALKLMLHQADAAKFMSRDGEADLKTVRQLEMLKGPKSRMFLQAIAWQEHCTRQRSFTLEEAEAICTDKDIFEAFRDSISGGRLPAFTVTDGAKGQEIQLAHLSFQELLASEYATAVLQHTSKSQHFNSYFNFLSSSSVAAQSRDRFAENWWLTVWLNVAEMLEEESFQAFCQYIGSDERAKLKAGRICYHFLEGDQISSTADPHQPKDIPFNLKSLRLTWLDEQARLVKLETFAPTTLKPGMWPFSDVDCALAEPMPVEMAHWFCEGVGTLACFCADNSSWRLLKALLKTGMHHCVCNKTCESVQSRCLANPDWTGVKLLAEMKADINFLQPDCLGRQKMRASARFEHPEAVAVQAPSPASLQLDDAKDDFTAPFREACAGTLQVTPELDCNLLHPSSGITLLMCAAASGNPDLVASLLQSRSNVKSRSSENCTALHFAVDCAWGNGANACVRLLLEARADPNARSGVTSTARTCTMGTGLMAGCMPALAGDMDKLDLLVEHGYDATMKSDMELSCLAWASIASSQKADRMIQRLLDLKCSYSDSLNSDQNKKCRVSKQQLFGANLINGIRLTVPRSVWEWVVSRFHVTDVFLQQLMKEVPVNHRVFKHNFPIISRTIALGVRHDVPMLEAVCNHIPLLTGDPSGIKLALANGLDLCQHHLVWDVSTCIKRKFLSLIMFPPKIPLYFELSSKTPPTADFFFTAWNHVFHDLPIDEKLWPYDLRCFVNLVKTGGESACANAWQDWKMARKFAAEHPN